MGLPSNWSAQQLGEFLAAVSAPQSSGPAIHLAVERAAESLDAEVAALVQGDAVAVSIGFPSGRMPEAELVAAAGRSDGPIVLPGWGPSWLASAPVAEAERLLVARQGTDGFAREEIQLLRGMARVLSLTLESIRVLERERWTQKRLAASERHTRQIIHAAHDAFIATDDRSRITDWNPQAEATFGWSGEDLLGRELTETIIPERHREAHRRGVRHFLATGEGPMLGTRLELSALHRDGYEFPVELTISALDTEDGHSFNAFLRDISERKRHECYLEAQHRTQVVLAEAERVSDAVPCLLQAIGEPMGWDFGAYWEFAGGRLHCQLSWMASGTALDAFDRASKQVRLEPGVGLPGRVFENGRPELVEDVRALSVPRVLASQEAGLSTAVALPLRVGGQTRGALEFFSRGARHPEPELIERMETLTGMIGRFFSIITERQELRAKLERLALTDELTGLSNRRAWEQGLQREVSRAQRAGGGMCVALVDLDGFKLYNDEYGHPAGDRLLRDTAAAWSSHLRTTDLLARLGGDEFGLALPAQPLDVALSVVERLHEATPHPLTCSAGLAAWRPEETAPQLTARADTALYQAKRTGRGRTVAAPSPATLLPSALKP